MDTERPECEMVDITDDRVVDLGDFVLFCENWLVGVE